jgi:GTP-binding protein
MIIDSATIEVRSGKGGDGAATFRREKYVPKGGPNGGDGGKGGSVILQASPQVETLLDFAGKHHWHAENGRPGEPKNRHGRNGADLLIELPVGTQVYDADTGQLLIDLDSPGKQHTIAAGGAGGYGNTRFKGPTNQTPTEATPGEAGLTLNLQLELKLIADVGLVGKPNAGKSTLLSRISRAHPRIADYPFTTLDPQLGIAELSGERRIVVADLPGLIEHAHEGQGLGTRFLRHIERTRLLVHVLEAAPMDGSDPVSNFQAIQQELGQYLPALAEKTQLVALSKMDALSEPNEAQALRQRVATAVGLPVIAISAVTGQGLEDLLSRSWAWLDAARESEAAGAAGTPGHWSVDESTHQS